jgi:hypothetical protein
LFYANGVKSLAHVFAKLQCYINQKQPKRSKVVQKGEFPQKSEINCTSLKV